MDTEELDWNHWLSSITEQVLVLLPEQEEEEEAGTEEPLEDKDPGGALKSIPISSSVYDQPGLAFLPRKHQKGWRFSGASPAGLTAGQDQWNQWNQWSGL